MSFLLVSKWMYVDVMVLLVSSFGIVEVLVRCVAF